MLNPVIAGAAMAASSVSVVSNALLLRRWRPPADPRTLMEGDLEMETVSLNVQGMTCGGCVASVTRVLKAVPGVDDVAVTLQPGAERSLLILRGQMCPRSRGHRGCRF